MPVRLISSSKAAVVTKNSSKSIRQVNLIFAPFFGPVLNELALDTNYENLSELRKAMFKAGHKFLRAKEISEFRVWTSCSGEFYKEFENYGFQLTGEGEYEYTYE